MHYLLGFCMGLLFYTAGEFNKIRNAAHILKRSISHNFSFFMAEGSTLFEGRAGTAWNISEQYILVSSTSNEENVSCFIPFLYSIFFVLPILLLLFLLRSRVSKS